LPEPVITQRHREIQRGLDLMHHVSGEMLRKEFGKMGSVSEF
jgi:hypothetical protein